MFFNKITVHKNKALDVCGITTITIDILKKILVLIGDNGSGKTTIMNEFNPLPSGQSDYNKGYSKLHITHNNKTYELESNFKKGMYHSFKEDGMELNSSHKNTIQKDLCEANLQFTPFINNVINMMYKITKIGPNDRRNLFFNAYPYMNEILNKHKKVSSVIKSYQSNLKMLNVRKTELLTECMSKKDIDELRDKYNLYRDQISEIDKILYNLDIECTNLRKELQDTKSDVNLNCEEVYQICAEYKRTISSINRGIDYTRMNTKDPSFVLNNSNTKKSILEYKIQNIESSVTGLTDEINKFESFLNTNSEEEQKYLEDTIKNLSEVVKDYRVDLSLPLLNKEQIELFERVKLSELEKHVLHIQTLNSKIYESEVVRRIENRITEIGFILSNNTTQLTNYYEQLTELKKIVFVLPPKVCIDDNCELRTNSLGDYNSKQIRKGKIEVLVKEIEEANVTLIRKSDNLKKMLEASIESETSVNYIRQVLSLYGLGDYVLNDKPIIKVINENVISIINKVCVVVKNSKDYIMKIDYENTISTCKFKLDIINKAPSKKMINDTLLNKQVELKRHLEDYKVISDDLEETTKTYNLSLTAVEVVDTLTKLKADWEVYSRRRLLSKTLEWNNDFVSKITVMKNNLTDNLVKIETSLRKQENIQVRLEQEVNPSIEKINKELYKYVLIEQALSPYNGIPKKYMIRFINNIINDVNVYVSSILNSNIEIELIDENAATVNYVFPIRINDIQIPDINKCSKAQSNIIDICLNLALYKQLNLNLNYPLIMDEPDDGFSEGNRTRLLMLLSSMVEQDQIHQLILISHFASMLSGFDNSDIICLSEENIVLPPVYNKNVVIK